MRCTVPLLLLMTACYPPSAYDGGRVVYAPAHGVFSGQDRAAHTDHSEAVANGDILIIEDMSEDHVELGQASSEAAAYPAGAVAVTATGAGHITHTPSSDHDNELAGTAVSRTSQAELAFEESRRVQARIDTNLQDFAPVSVRASSGVRSLNNGTATLTELIKVGVSVDGLRTSLRDLRSLATAGNVGLSNSMVTAGGVSASAQLADLGVLSEGGETDLVVEVRGAPGSPHQSRRPPLRVHVVLDSSSSMQSSWPSVVASANTLIDQLHPRDEVQIVAYGDKAKEVYRVTKVGNGRAAKSALKNVSVGGGTNIEAGLRVAYRSAAKTSRGGKRSVVILLSDGVPNRGYFEADELAPLASSARKQSGCTTTVIGLGNEFAPKTLRAIADAGSGAYHVARSPRELAPMLEQELAAQKWVASAHVSLGIALGNGASVVGVHPAATRNRLSFAAPNLQEGEVRRWVVRVSVKPGMANVADMQLRVGVGQNKKMGSGLVAADTAAHGTAGLAALDADLAVSLDAAARLVLEGRGSRARAVLVAHAKTARSSRVYRAHAGVAHRTHAVNRFATALHSLVTPASHSQRRELSISMGQLAFSLTR